VIDENHPWRAWVLNGNDVIIGAAVLIDRWHALTCAHVVAKALGHEGSGAPREPVTLWFPFVGVGEPSGEGWQVAAAVVPDRWVQATTDEQGDLALLRLEVVVPPEYPAAMLDRCEPSDRRQVKVFGRSANLDTGVWASATVNGVTGPGGEWAQIDPETGAELRVERGFSGAGVVDRRTGRVVGVVVAADPDAARRVAWIVRMETVARYVPEVGRLLGGLAPSDGRVSSPVPEHSVPERPLSDDEHQALFARLWAVPGMSSRRARDLYLDQLTQRLGAPLAIRRQPDDDILDVWAILYSLVARPGAMRELAVLLAVMRPGDLDVVRLRHHVELVFPDLLLEHAERVALEGYLEGVSSAKVGVAYRWATQSFGVLPSSLIITVTEVLRDLEGRGRGHGVVPALLVFVEDLAHALGGRPSTELHRWIDQVAHRLEIAPAARHKLCDEAERRNRQQTLAYLVIVLEPDGADCDLYQMSVVLHASGEPERVVLRDDESRTLAEVEAALDDVVLRLVPEAVGGDLRGLVLDFVLPRRLLGTAVDKWKFDRDNFPLPLGMRYPVVVRCLEWTRDPNARAALEVKSRRLVGYGRRADDSAAYHFLRDARVDSPSPTEGLDAYACLAGDERLVVLSVPFPPDPTVPASADVFRAGLSAGMPAIIWSQEAVEPTKFREVVRSELLTEGPAELPRQVLRYRLRRYRNRGGAGQAESSAVSVPVRPAVGILFSLGSRVPSPSRSFRFCAPRRSGPVEGDRS
jgi:hypothetical protein